VPYRRAHVERIEQGEILDLLLQQIGEPEQDGLAFGGQNPPPGAFVERPPRRPDGKVDVLCVALGDFGQQFAGRWVPGLESSP
jgi:hypothetical protein